MRKPTPIAAALLATTVLAAQGGLNFTSPDGNIEAHGADGRILTDFKQSVYRFEITGGGGKVHAIVHDQGLEFFSSRLEGVAVPDPTSKKAKALMLKRATASGGVRVIKTSDGNRTELAGATANFTGTAKAGSLTLGGGVKMTNLAAEKAQSLVATGSSAVATLATVGKKESPVRTATLRGPVSIDAIERNSRGGVDKVHATGSRLEIDNTVRPAKLSLVGNVRADSPQHGHFSGEVIVLRITDKGEVVSIEARTRS
jgi:hypothetical protein